MSATSGSVPGLRAGIVPVSRNRSPGSKTGGGWRQSGEHGRLRRHGRVGRSPDQCRRSALAYRFGSHCRPRRASTVVEHAGALARRDLVSKSVRKLQATYQDISEDELRPLDESADGSAISLSLAIHAVWRSLQVALNVADDLAAMRAEWADSLGDDGDPFGPLAELRKLDRLVSSSREIASLTVAGQLARKWELQLGVAQVSGGPSEAGNGGETQQLHRARTTLKKPSRTWTTRIWHPSVSRSGFGEGLPGSWWSA